MGNKRVYISIVIATIVISVISILFFKSRGSKDKLTIAVNIPLTGPIAAATDSFPKGLKMGVHSACEELNVPEEQIYISIMDNQGKASEGVSVFQKQMLEEFDVYISGVSDVTKEIIGLVDSTHVPHYLVAFDKKMPELGENRIRLLANYNLEIPLYENFVKGKSPKRVFSICHASSVNQEIFTTGVEPFLKENNIEFMRENVDWSTSDYRTLSLKIKKFNPDLILINAFSGQMQRLLPALRDQDLIKNHNTYCGLDFVDFVGMNDFPDFAKDIVFTATEFDFNKTTRINGWEKQYYEQYNVRPTYISAYGYDTGRMIIYAFAKEGVVNVNSLLKTTPFEGMSGIVVIDKKTRDLQSTLLSVYYTDKKEFKKWSL